VEREAAGRSAQRMLTADKNDRLTRVGPGTAMGTLLRRYWWPIAPSAMVGLEPVKRRLLGEDLVLFRDRQGRLGLLAEQCPHRRASLSLGCVEGEGLRCGYHGWLFDTTGQCLEQPGEPADSEFKDRIRTTAYRVQELGGLVFAYLGPDTTEQPAPLLPRYDLFVRDDVWRDIGHAVVPCNFLQIMENSVDPYHVEWLHGRYGSFLRELAGEPELEVLRKKHVKVAFEVFEHGILKRRLLEGQTEDDEDWKTGHPLVFPGMLRIGGGGLSFFQIRVPIDDENTWHVWYQTYRPEHGQVPPQGEIPDYEVPLKDENGDWIRDYVDGQDVTAWVTQGTIADRTQEHLGTSDLGVMVLRRLFQEQMDLVEDGHDPICTYRDPGKNVCIELPQEKEKFGGGEAFRREFLPHGQTRYSPIRSEVAELFGDTTLVELAAR
jgi:5,5'-dehydrodivanillate O-demethylase